LAGCLRLGRGRQRQTRETTQKVPGANFSDMAG
jgi:hypothetical protein